MIGGRFEAFMVLPSATTVAATCTGQAGTSVGLTAGNYTPTSYCTHLAARLNAVAPRSGGGTWTVTLSTGTSGTGLVTIGLGGNTFTVAWTTAAAGTVIGFASSATNGSPTGTTQARGLWLPDCPITLAGGHPKMAPRQTDNRATESPQGLAITIGGCVKYQHKGIRYSHVPVSRVREAAATTTYASLEQWVNDTQLGAGHSWFDRGSAFQAYWDNGGSDVLVGYDLNSGAGPTYGWAFSPAIEDLSNHIKPASDPWVDGPWAVEFGRIVSRG